MITIFAFVFCFQVLQNDHSCFKVLCNEYRVCLKILDDYLCVKVLFYDDTLWFQVLPIGHYFLCVLMSSPIMTTRVSKSSLRISCSLPVSFFRFVPDMIPRS